MNLLEHAHRILSDRLSSGNIAIDATVGNGHDTLFLLRQVAPTGQVYGFDVQSAAIDATRELVAQTGFVDGLTLTCASHADLAKLIPKHCHGKIAACMFNLGYLPGSDKTVTTRTQSTLTGLNATSSLLGESGMITIMAYPGHSGGAEETVAVSLWCAQLDPTRYHVRLMCSEVARSHAPRLYVIEKIG